MTYCVTLRKQHQILISKGVLVSQRQTQLKLVFSNSIRITEPRSRPLKMSRVDYSTRSQRTESPFLRRMRELEQRAPQHAAVLLSLANDILDDQPRQLPPLE